MISGGQVGRGKKAERMHEKPIMERIVEVTLKAHGKLKEEHPKAHSWHNVAVGELKKSLNRRFNY